MHWGPGQIHNSRDIAEKPKFAKGRLERPYLKGQTANTSGPVSLQGLSRLIVGDGGREKNQAIFRP